jgi:exoribonuclease R
LIEEPAKLDVLSTAEQARAVSQFERSCSKVTGLTIQHLNNLYDELSGVTRFSTYTIAETILPKLQEKGHSDISVELLWYAVLSHTLRDNLHFHTPDFKLTRQTGTMYRRSEDEVRELKTLLTEVRMQSESFRSVVKKIKDAFNSSGFEKPTLKEERYLAALEQFAVMPRFSVGNIFSTISTMLLKAVGEFSVMDKEAARAVLVKIGRWRSEQNPHDIFIGPFLDLKVEPFHLRTKHQVDNAAKAKSKSSSNHFDVDALSACLDQENRRDFGNTPVLAIDSNKANEIDDGISLEVESTDSIWIHVHVADPSTLLQPSHAEAALAKKLTTTLYLPDRIFPMIANKDLSNLFSLGSVEGRPQPAMTFSFKVNGQGDISDYRIGPSIVRNVRNLTYEDAARVLSDPDSKSSSSLPASLKTTLQTLHRIAQSHLERRISKEGAAMVSRPKSDIHVEYDDDGKAAISVTTYASEDNPAMVMVAELMIMAGRVAAKFCIERDIPAIYRSQGTPLGQDLSGLSGRLDWVTWLKRFSQIQLPPGVDSSQPKGHVSMGLDDGYTKVTSPLRRFQDLLMHWQIKSFLSHGKYAACAGKPLFSLHDIQSFLSPIGSSSFYHTQHFAKFYQMRSRTFWLLHYFTLQPQGTLYPAVVSSTGRVQNTENSDVILENYGQRATVCGSLPNLTVGDRVEVVIKQVNPILGKFEVDILRRL